jgi:hypothetical protein
VPWDAGRRADTRACVERRATVARVEVKERDDYDQATAEAQALIAQGGLAETASSRRA